MSEGNTQFSRNLFFVLLAHVSVSILGLVLHYRSVGGWVVQWVVQWQPLFFHVGVARLVYLGQGAHALLRGRDI